MMRLKVFAGIGIALLIIFAVIVLLLRGMIAAEKKAATSARQHQEIGASINDIAKANEAAASGRHDPAIARADCLRDAWNPEAC